MAAAGPAAVLWVRQADGGEIERLLHALQTPVRHCGSGREAIEIARGGPLACVVAPLQMPDMGAKSLIEALREVAPGLAVIIIVDNPAVDEAVAVMRSGAHAVIDSRIVSTGLRVHLAPLLRSH